MAETIGRPVNWVLSGNTLMRMLARVEAGETAEIVYLEEYANAEVEYPEDEED